MTELNVTYQNVVDLLIQKVPELRPLLDSHLHDQFGQLLQHVFFGDVTRYVVEQLHSSETDVVQRVLYFLNSAMESSDARVKELVLASFLENIDQNDRSFGQLNSMMGSNLRRELKRSGRSGSAYE